MALFSVFDDMGESETPSFLRIYDSLHPELKRLLDEVSKYFDIALIAGYRENEENEELPETKRTRKKHAIMPSEAVDMLPYPINRDNRVQIAYLAGHMRMCARMLGIGIAWGGDLQDIELISGELKNNSYVHHFELVF